MKNIITVLAFLLTGLTSFASYNISLSGSYFYSDSDPSTPLTSANVAIIIDRSKGDFSDFLLNAGDFIASETAINERYFTLELTALISSGPLAGQVQFQIDNIVNSLYGLSGGETFALLCFTNESGTFGGTIEEGTKYMVFNPNMVTEVGVDPLSGGTYQWVIPTADGAYSYFLTTGDLPRIPQEYTTLSNVVIPEPASVAAILGVFAIGFLIVRRRR